MNRKFLRMTLIGLVALAAFASVWPAISASIGLKISYATNNAKHSSSAQSYNSGACSAQSPGVTLVIDFGSASAKKVLTRCVLSSEQHDSNLTGWSVFKAAGLTVTGTTQYPVGFVCRVDGYPSVADQTCQNTPTSAQGSWVYFGASGKSGWQLEMVGAASTHPKCGNVQGWRFVGPTDTTSPNAEALHQTPKFEPKPFNCQK